MGNRPVPTVLKKLRGNPGKKALPKDEPEGQGDLWMPPEWFSESQRVQWQYAIDHAPPGLLTGTDRETLAIWCVASVEYAECVQRVREQGQIVETKAGNVILNPYMGAMNRQALIMLRAGAELGFSPSARASLGLRGGTRESRSPMISTRSGSIASYIEEYPGGANH